MSYIRATRNVNIVCGILFLLFTAVYLLFFQRELILSLSDNLLKFDVASYVVYALSGISIFFLLISLLIGRLLSLRGVLSSLCYFPALLMIGIATSQDVSPFSGNMLEKSWFYIFPLIVLLFLLVVCGVKWFFHISLERERSGVILANWNISFLILQIVMTLCIGNTDLCFHYELKVDRLIATGNAKKALGVGEKSLSTTKRLSTLRTLALAKSDSLASRTFFYPQNYGSLALLFNGEENGAISFGNGEIYKTLGVKKIKGEGVKEYLKRVAYRDKTNKAAVDYYLISLLLDKEVNEFVRVLPDFYTLDSKLPRHYKEALLVSSIINGKPFTLDAKMGEEYLSFISENDKKSSLKERENLSRKLYGNTYMWYYTYK